MTQPPLKIADIPAMDVSMKGNDIMREDDESYNKSYPLIITTFLMYILKGNNSKPRYKIDNTEYKLSFTL